MSLGVYKDIHPFNHLSEDRLNAYLYEAQRQNIELLFFGIEQVDFIKRTINGDFFNGVQWEKKEVSFPKLMLNDFAGRSDNSIDAHAEKKLKIEISQTVHLIENKLALSQKLIHTASAPLILPSKALTHINIFWNMLKQYNKIVLKPIDGRQGKEIFVISKHGKEYNVQDHYKVIHLVEKQILKFIQFVVSKRNYLVQPFINCRTNGNNPFDFRIHAMKNGMGEWFIFTTRVRVGQPETNLTNTSRDGQSSDAALFLRDNFGDKSAENLLISIENVSIQLAKDIEGFYPYPLDELGIDLAQDEQGEIWFYEANTSPQILTNATLREKDRATHMIGYAKHLLGNLQTQGII